MATEAPTSPSETSCDDNIQSKPKNFFGQNKALVLGCLIYFTYSMSISVDSQFLSLYYKSKGFDGSTLGVLYSILPLTTFLTIPIWSVVTRKGSKGKDDTPGDKKDRRQYQILCANIVIATLGQFSLSLLDEPIYMMLAITVVGVFQSPAKPILDGILIDHMEDKSDFGKVRFFSILGSGFGTNLGGRLLWMVQKSTANDNAIVTQLGNQVTGTAFLKNLMLKASSGFNLLFLARFILTIPPLIFIRQLQLKATMKTKHGEAHSTKTDDAPVAGEEKATDGEISSTSQEVSTSVVSVTRDVMKHCFGDRNHLLFFLCIYIAGASGGVSDAFSYLRYQESGCSTTHMGQSRLLSSCAGAVMFWFSGRVTKKLGVQNVLFLSMLCAGVRFSLLKRMDHPYYVYAVDFIRGATFGAFWSSSTLYASKIGPPSLRSSILLLLNGIYNGIGRSTGAVLGGRFQAVFGTNNLFLCCARINYALALVMGIWYNRARKNDLGGEVSPERTKKTN